MDGFGVVSLEAVEGVTDCCRGARKDELREVAPLERLWYDPRPRPRPRRTRLEDEVPRPRPDEDEVSRPRLDEPRCEFMATLL